MINSPENSEGVGEHDEQVDRSKFHEYLAHTALLTLELAASDLWTLASTHPLEFPNAHRRGLEIRQIIASLDAELKQAGYTDSEIRRIKPSDIKPAAHDPAKPRTNT